MIKTSRLILKPYSDNDENRMVEILTNETIKKTFMIPDFKSRDEAVKLFKRLRDMSYSKDHYELGIYVDDELIGFVNDVENENNVIELGYVIHPDFHNKGYATEMLAAVIDDLFSKGYKKVCCGAFVNNIASQRVMIKSGMIKIDKEDDIEYHGKLQHCVYYEITKSI